MQNLKITIIQPNIIWENPNANLKKYSDMFSEIESTDVILLPETFTTGFSMNVETVAERMDGRTVEWMKKIALEKNVSIAGSLIIKENGSFYNRLVWVFPEGNVVFYDKRHLFTMGEEHLFYTRGNKKLIVDFRGWKFCPLICYDLRFPVWSRNTDNYDVLVYVANWPVSRNFVWNNLLIARALENQSYCIGVNRTGTDGNGIESVGNSTVVSPKGSSEMFGESEAIKTFQLSRTELQLFRDKFSVLNDRDDFEII